ncbi:PQQ-binding-like beta-propeller repeat protein [Streptomyces sp. NPDC006435]|uniref:PQQ-binding-like beta-propeller repeat protein n=1 Tax=Streptomyces sp. NPDC006435 TaxID=3154300 RepID=UPI0033ABC95E
MGSPERPRATVADGIVYIRSVHTVYALDATTGEKKWAHAIKSNPYGGCSTPAVVDGVVYVGSYEGTGDDWEGRVLALDAATGKKKWSYATGGVVTSSPAVAGRLHVRGQRRQERLRLEQRRHRGRRPDAGPGCLRPAGRGTPWAVCVRGTPLVVSRPREATRSTAPPSSTAGRPKEVIR